MRIGNDGSMQFYRGRLSIALTVLSCVVLIGTCIFLIKEGLIFSGGFMLVLGTYIIGRTLYPSIAKKPYIKITNDLLVTQTCPALLLEDITSVNARKVKYKNRWSYYVSFNVTNPEQYKIKLRHKCSNILGRGYFTADTTILSKNDRLLLLGELKNRLPNAHVDLDYLQ